MAAVRPLIIVAGQLQEAAATDTIDIGAAGGGGSLAVATKTTTYTITTSDSVILADTTSGDFTVTLPTAVGATKEYQIKKIAAAGVLTIASTSGTIDGSVTLTILNQYTALTFVSDGTNWFIF